jgi:hypothetical protein
MIRLPNIRDNANNSMMALNQIYITYYEDTKMIDDFERRSKATNEKRRYVQPLYNWHGESCSHDARHVAPREVGYTFNHC